MATPSIGNREASSAVHDPADDLRAVVAAFVRCCIAHSFLRNADPVEVTSSVIADLKGLAAWADLGEWWRNPKTAASLIREAVSVRTGNASKKVASAGS